jgi:hypothetical protein
LIVWLDLLYNALVRTKHHTDGQNGL